VFRECYGFCELNLIHCFLEIMGTMPESQKRRSQLPNSPFYDYSNHPSEDIRADDTILLKYTL